jgi:hypothetical protein
MNRAMSLMFLFLLALASVAFGQVQQVDSQSPEDSVNSTELIAWSGLQKPQPAPQPLPPPDTAVPQPDPSQNGPGKQQSEPQTQQAPSESQQPTAQSFVGKILKDGGKYVLKVSSNTSYQLLGEVNAEKYENQNVKVVGDLDSRNNTIHVVRIDLLS